MGICHRLKKLVQQAGDSSFVVQVVDKAVRSMLAVGSIEERQVVAIAAEAAPIVTWLAGPTDSILLEVVPNGWRVLGCGALRCRRSGSWGIWRGRHRLGIWLPTALMRKPRLSLKSPICMKQDHISHCRVLS